MLRACASFRRRVVVGVAMVCAVLASACGSGGSGSPTPTSTVTNTAGPSPSATASGSTGGTLTLTGQVSDSATVQSPVACNSPQGLSLQGGAGNIYQLLMTDLTPGATDLSTASSQISVELTLVSGAGTRYVWQGGSGMGSGTVTAPASASALNSSPGVYSIDAMLVPAPGNGATSSERISGLWPCF